MLEDCIECEYKKDKQGIQIIKEKFFQMLVSLDSKIEKTDSALEDINNFLTSQIGKDDEQDKLIKLLQSRVEDVNRSVSKLETHLDNGWKKDLIEKMLGIIEEKQKSKIDLSGKKIDFLKIIFSEKGILIAILSLITYILTTR